MDGLGNSVNVLGIQTRNAHASILSHVNVILLDQAFDLISSQTSKGKHTNLVSNVRPVALGSKINEFLNKLFSASTNAISHLFDITAPLV